MSQLADSLSGQFDRLPPSAVEAEMCLLASMMLDKDMIGQVVQIVDREAFYQADHQIIFTSSSSSTSRTAPSME